MYDSKNMVPGQKIGTSPWIEMTQEMNNQFGTTTQFEAPHHMDPEWCRKHRPAGGTVAYGFLTMSLLMGMFMATIGCKDGVGFGPGVVLNYGFDKLRFLALLPCDARVRGHFHLQGQKPRGRNGILQTVDVEVEVDGSQKPALAAEWLILHQM